MLRKINVLLGMLLFLIGQVSAQIVFSEVMYDVPGADYNDEFIEFYNCGDSAIDLSGWKFSDSSGVDAIIDAGQGTVLKPGQFALLLDGSYFGHSTVYDSLIPSSALVLTIDDNAFGSNGLSNSKGERLSLINSSGREIAAYRYAIGNEPGYSDEKIILCAGNDSANWAVSKRLWGTPGFKNSVTPEDYDLSFAKNGLFFRPQSAVKKGQTVQGILKFFNSGLNPFNASVHFKVFVDLNGDGRAENLEPILFEEDKQVALPIQMQDTLQFVFKANFSGALKVVAILASALDQERQNNTFQKPLMVIDTENPLKINEIKFLTQKGEPEWVEVFNAGNETLNLRSWALTDGNDTLTIKNDCFVKPKGFKVITADSALFNFYDLADSLVLVADHLPTLNNDSDDLFLLAPWGDWVEQVPYKKSWLWGEAQRLPSLERINPLIDARLERNWGPSVAEQGATPGQPNSLFEPLKSSKLKLSIDPNPFSPNGDGFEDNAIISIQMPTHAAYLRATIFDILGRKIVTLSNNHLSGQTSQLIWNGRDARREYVRTGIYIIFVQILDDRNGILKEAKTTIDVVQ